MIATSARLKGGQQRQVDEVDHRVVADPVGEVAERAADQQPDARPRCPGRVGSRAKNASTEDQRGRRDHDQQPLALAEEAERDAAVVGRRRDGSRAQVDALAGRKRAAAIAFVTWSSARTIAPSPTARSQPRRAGGSPADQPDDDALRDEQQDDRRGSG